MTAMTRTDILNLALREIGASRVDDFSEASAEAVIGRDCWEQAVRKALSRHEWQFAMKVAQCGRDGSVPVARYDYRYVVPADCIRLAYVADNTLFEPVLDQGAGYVQRAGFIETSALLVYVEYVYDAPSIGVWPSWFIDVLVADYASVMSSPLKSTTERERLEKLAEKRLSEARSLDSSQRPKHVPRPGGWRLAASGGWR